MRPHKALLSFFLLLATVLPRLVSAQSRQGERPVTIRVNNIKFRDLFSIILDQTQLAPLFNSDQLNSEERVSVDFDNEPMDNVLASLLRGRGLTWQYDDNTYIVKFKQPGDPDLGVLPGEKVMNISGQVTDQNGSLLEGATVMAKASGKSTLTNKDGRFHIDGIPRNSSLTVSSVGYLTKDIPVKNENKLNVELEGTITALDEVVVIAYGTSTRRNLTGAISRITAADIAKQPTGSPLLAMQGRIPGLFITQRTGLPGGEIKVALRGRNSIASGNNPLYIVDGVPYPTTALTLNNVLPNGEGISPLGASNPLTTLNGADIESIEVLKDADATSIYGSRAANGVILVTTRKGQPGKMKLDATIYSGTGKSGHRMQFLDTRQYLQMRKEAFSNDGSTPQGDDLSWGSLRYTDWEKELLGGTAHITDAQLAITGGSNNFQFRVTSGRRGETTVYPGSFKYNKTSVHGNFIFTTADQKGSAIITAGYTAERNYLPSVDLAAFTRTPPNAPPSYTNGDLLNWEAGTYDNPMGALLRTYKGNTGNLMGNLVFNYNLLEGLQFKTNFGYNSILASEKQITPFRSINPVYGYDPRDGGYSKFGNNSFSNWIIEPQITYRKELGKGHHLSVLLGVSFQQDNRDQKGFFATGFSSDATQQLEDILAAAKIEALASGSYIYRYGAFFSRINYNYRGKYFLHLTGRREASSRFAPDNHMSNFGSAGAAWIFSEEKRLKSALPFLSFGKLRGSYGISGNDQIEDAAFSRSFSPGMIYDNQRGQLPARLSNKNYMWELCKKLEAAMEMGFNQDKIIFRISYYHNQSTNQLVDHPLSLITGFNSVLDNFPAKVKNSGWELELNANNIRRGEVTWNASFNLSVPRNKLVSFPNIENSSYNGRLSVGEPLEIVKGYSYQGMDAQSGIYTFAGVKDGNVAPGANTHTKKAGVNLYGGLQSNLQYKGWYLDILLQFVAQNGYNYLLMDQAPGMAFVNQPLAVLDRWQTKGDISNVQRFTQGSHLAYQSFFLAQQSDAIIKDASFIRLKNIQLGYNLPGKWTSKARLRSARFFLQGQNLYTFTRFRGRDPEVAADHDIYPPLRICVIGLQLEL